MTDTITKEQYWEEVGRIAREVTDSAEGTVRNKADILYRLADTHRWIGDTSACVFVMQFTEHPDAIANYVETIGSVAGLDDWSCVARQFAFYALRFDVIEHHDYGRVVEPPSAIPSDLEGLYRDAKASAEKLFRHGSLPSPCGETEVVLHQVLAALNTFHDCLEARHRADEAEPAAVEEPAPEVESRDALEARYMNIKKCVDQIPHLGPHRYAIPLDGSVVTLAPLLDLIESYRTRDKAHAELVEAASAIAFRQLQTPIKVSTESLEAFDRLQQALHALSETPARLEADPS